jgi:hypothetical protein
MSYLDMRDLAKELEDLRERVEDSDETLDDDDRERLAALEGLEKELGGDLDASANNEPTMIPESEFTAYAQELAEDCCDVPRDLKWPFTCIDWSEAADQLKCDYNEVDFDGETYLIRA